MTDWVDAAQDVFEQADTAADKEGIQRLKAEADKYRAMQANGWEFNCTTGSSHVALSKGDVPHIEIHA